MIDKWIQSTNTMLKETEKNKKATIDKYNLIQNQISNRQSLLGNINSQLENAQLQLDDNEGIISLLRSDIESLRQDYYQMLRFAYRKKLVQNKWLYVLSSSSVREAMLKLRYSQQYNDFKNQKASIIQDKIQELEAKSEALDTLIVNQKSLAQNEKEANQKLENELYEKDVILSALTKNSVQLRTELSQQEKEKQRLDKLLRDIISKEVAKTNAAPLATTSASSTNASFEKNRGQLSWPMDNGFVSSRFGVQQHPTLSNVTIQNNGIDIRATAGSNVRAIYEGTVTTSMNTPGYGKMVIIKKDNILIVYARMSDVYVQEGDDINRGQTIGKLGIYNDKSELQLQIWNGNEKLNPQNWIRSRK